MSNKRTKEAVATAAVVEPITLEQLARRLADPDHPEEEFVPYLTAGRSLRGFEPLLLPNNNVDVAGDSLRTRANLGLGFLNGAARRRRLRTFERRLAANDGAPVILAEGNSWFQYPIWVRDVVDHLVDDFNVCCLSAAGDEIDNMAIRRPEYLEWVERLTGGGQQLRALLISGGGNDLVGDQLAGMILDFEEGRGAPAYLETHKYRIRAKRIENGYRTILATIRQRWPKLPIIVHGYDYGRPLPDQGFNVPPRDGWTGKPMRARGIVDPALQLSIVEAMIDRFNDILMRLAAEFSPVVRMIPPANTKNARSFQGVLCLAPISPRARYASWF